MCGPQGIMTTQAVGAMTSTVGSYYTAKGEKAALNAQAGIADINARISNLRAEDSLRQGQREEQKVMLNTSQLKGRQKASIGASGVAFDSQSVNAVLTTTDVLGEIDANTVNVNAARNAWGHRFQATDYTNQGILKRSAAKNISPLFAAGESLLTGATQVAKTRYALQKAGSWPEQDWLNRNVGL